MRSMGMKVSPSLVGTKSGAYIGHPIESEMVVS